MSDVTKPEEEAASGSGESSEPPSSAPESSPDSKVAAPAPPPPPPTHRPNYVFLAAVSILSLATDLGSKWWAKANLEMPLDETRVNLPRRIELIKGWVALVFARNKGGAWGLLQ